MSIQNPLLFIISINSIRAEPNGWEQFMQMDLLFTLGVEWLRAPRAHRNWKYVILHSPSTGVHHAVRNNEIVKLVQVSRELQN